MFTWQPLALCSLFFAIWGSPPLLYDLMLSGIWSLTVFSTATLILCFFVRRVELHIVNIVIQRFTWLKGKLYIFAPPSTVTFGTFRGAWVPGFDRYPLSLPVDFAVANLSGSSAPLLLLPPPGHAQSVTRFAHAQEGTLWLHLNQDGAWSSTLGNFLQGSGC